MSAETINILAIAIEITLRGVALVTLAAVAGAAGGGIVVWYGRVDAARRLRNMRDLQARDAQKRNPEPSPTRG